MSQSVPDNPCGLQGDLPSQPSSCHFARLGAEAVGTACQKHEPKNAVLAWRQPHQGSILSP